VAYNAANLAGPPSVHGVCIWTCSTASGDDCPDEAVLNSPDSPSITADGKH